MLRRESCFAVIRPSLRGLAELDFSRDGCGGGHEAVAATEQRNGALSAAY